ncbi:30S ribosomal protein S3 [bacterium]|nr:30S ribosomal protein S3 [bacterium]
MSHKVHPKIFRVKGPEDWLSRGFYQKNLSKYLKEDFLIRSVLKNKLKQALTEDIEIERNSSTIKIIIKTARPALVIGRGGQEVEKLKKEIEKVIEKANPEFKKEGKDIKIEILEIKAPWASANLAAQWVASQIEKKVPYRRVLKMALRKIMDQKEVKGARIEVSGRLNGIEIARSEWLREGKLPRQTMRAVIDYGFCQAHCTYGVIGVKVWIYKGEKF